jgi:hypothetical protein
MFAQAQDPPAPFSAGSINYSGYVDGYYSLNFNHPASFSNGYYRFFDRQANQLTLNMAGLYMSVDPAPIGATLQLGFGRGWDLFHATEPGGDGGQGRSIVRFIPQAYITVKPTNWGGFQFDFGKFVTSASFELTETHLGWAYSRGIMYSNGPFYHVGARMSKPIKGPWTMGFQLVNGWNNIEDGNSGKTVGITSAIAGKKVGLFNNYYVGPEKAGTNKGKRNYLNNVLTLTPNDKFSAALTYDVAADAADYGLGRGSNNWYAWGVHGRYQATPAWAVSGRYEYYNDIDGLITLVPQALKEYTATLEYKHPKGFLTRFEYRHDWSNVPYFDRGNELGVSKDIDTLLVGFVVVFGPK